MSKLDNYLKREGYKRPPMTPLEKGLVIAAIICGLIIVGQFIRSYL